MTQPYHRQVGEIETCTRCGRQFDLAQQPYYDTKCPSCIQEIEPDRLKRSCTVCETEVLPSELQPAQLQTYGQSERVLVCSDECKRDAETPPWAPKHGME